MIRFLVIVSILFTMSYANSEKHFIKFGSFKNIYGLEKSISKLPNSLRSHVIIFHANGWYIPIAYATKNKNALYSKVASYKRYFPDAHIAKSSNIFQYPIVKSYIQPVSSTQKTYSQPYVAPSKVYVQPPVQRVVPQAVRPQYQNVAISEEDNILGPIVPIAQPMSSNPSTVKTTIIVPTVVKPNDFKVEERIQYKNFSKEMLSGQYYYLAYKASSKNPNLLIKVSFSSDEVTYQPIIGDMKMTKANYLVDNNRLYMFTNDFTREGAFSKLEEHRANHFLVSSWANGKKLNTLRYYYKMNDAKEYLGIDTSNGLAEVLQDGDFEDLSWN